MCVKPLKLSNGQMIACRKCWQCRENKVNDWVGRCIAESETATASHSITLTYDGGDHVRAAVLTYSDVQKYFKLLRRHDYPCRYFAIGEYGSTKGRSHWHVMVFWQGAVPSHQVRERFLEEHWPHGWSYWDEPNPASIRYICKYIQKDMGKDERQGHLAMSKKPPLGHDYFVQLAGRYVAQGLAPQDPYYWFNHVRDSNDQPLKFYLAGVSLDNFCQAYLDQWNAANPGVHHPHSPLIEDFCDRVAAPPFELLVRPFTPRMAYPWVSPPDGAEIRFSDAHNLYFVEVEGRRLWWSFNDEGKRAWHAKIRTTTEAERLEREHLRRSDPLRYSNAKSGAGVG